MLELLAKVEQAAVPLAFTLTYPDNFPLYREDYNGSSSGFLPLNPHETLI